MNMIFFDLDFEDEHILLKFNFSVVTLRDGQRAGFWRPGLTRPEIPGSGSEITGLTRSNSGPGQKTRGFGIDGPGNPARCPSLV